MKLDDKEFRRFKDLQKLVKSGKASQAEKAELADLEAKKNEKGSNDLQWWKNYPALLESVTNLPFNWIPGTQVDITGYNGASDSLKLGVMAKAILRPGIGRSTTDADAFNAQIRQLWLDMHRRYRGIGTYEKSDLGIAILAINSAFETLAKFERIYGVINTYHVGNRVVPNGLKEMLGISDDLEENLADFRYQLNLCISKLKQLCLPKGMSVLMSDIIAIANLFKDSENRRAFIFGFDTDTFGVYDPTAFTTGGCVKYKLFSSGYQTGTTKGMLAAFTLADVIKILNEQISALLNDDDIARICSDLLAAYGPENVMQLTELPENYTIEPVHDYERQIQFHNLTLCGPVAGIYDDNVIDNSTAGTLMSSGIPIVIYQNNNTVMCELGISDDQSSYVLVGSKNYPSRDLTVISDGHTKQGDCVFDTWVEKPSDVEIMCGTRYMAISGAFSVVTTNVIRQEITVFGTKVCVGLQLFSAINSGTYQRFVLANSVVDATHFQNTYWIYTKLMQMDWHPIFYIPTADLEVFGDIDNFTIISGANLQRLHEVALLSGYKIPMVASGDR